MKSPRDSYTLQHLNKLCYPGQSKFLTDAFSKATKLPYSYLFLDWHVNTPDEYRIRSSIFPVKLFPCTLLLVVYSSKNTIF